MTTPAPTVLTAAITRMEAEIALFPETDFPVEHEQTRAVVAAAKAYVDAQEDAARWRALMSSQRIRVMGSAGLARDFAGHLIVRAGGRIHIGVEFWNIHDAPHPSAEHPQERSREMLAFYVDHLRAALTGPT